MDEEDWDGWKLLTERLGDRVPARRRRPLRHQPRAPAARHRAGRRQLDPGQGQPDRHADRDARGDRDRPRRRLHGGDLAPLRRDRGHDDRRPRGRHRRRPDQDRRARRARTASRSTTSCCGSRRSSATAPSSRAPRSSTQVRRNGVDGMANPERMPARASAQRAARVGPSRIRWDRLGRIALVLVLFGVLVSYLNPLVNLLRGLAGIEVERVAARAAQAGEGRPDQAAARGLEPGRRSSARRAAWAWSSPASTPTSSTASATTERPLRSLRFSPRI